MKAFDLRKLTSLTTPADEFFAFHQTKTVEADAASWRLRIGGLVKRPVELSLDDLRKRARGGSRGHASNAREIRAIRG